MGEDGAQLTAFRILVVCAVSEQCSMGLVRLLVAVLLFYHRFLRFDDIGRVYDRLPPLGRYYWLRTAPFTCFRFLGLLQEHFVVVWYLACGR